MWKLTPQAEQHIPSNPMLAQVVSTSHCLCVVGVKVGEGVNIGEAVGIHVLTGGQLNPALSALLEALT